MPWLGDDDGAVDTQMQWIGPYRDGPPESDLVAQAPPLTGNLMGDFGRFLVVVWGIGTHVLRRVIPAWFRRRGGVEAAFQGLVDGFIALGPTFVKAGQIIASSGSMFPDRLAKEARRCLDSVPTFSSAEVRATIEADLGAPVEVCFAAFEDVPLSAASIGQVHGVTLPDGRAAVVKVQRPNIHNQMAKDLRNAFRVAWLIEHTPWGKTSGAQGIIRDLHDVTFHELNPAREAWQQDRFRSKIGAFGDNQYVTAPEVYWNWCGPRVITMERVVGTPMDRFEELQARGIDGQLVLRRGAKVWAEAAMVHGPFHGDMHAGNIWVLDDGRGCFLDFGIMGELDPKWQALMKDLFYTCAFDQDFTRVAHAYREVGAIPPGFGSDEELAAFLNSVLGPMLAGGFHSIDIVALINSSLEMLKAYEASIPQELALIAKQLLYIDRYTKFLAPEYSITADPFIVRNVFPEEAAKKAADEGIEMPD